MLMKSFMKLPLRLTKYHIAFRTSGLIENYITFFSFYKGSQRRNFYKSVQCKASLSEYVVGSQLFSCLHLAIKSHMSECTVKPKSDARSWNLCELFACCHICYFHSNLVGEHGNGHRIGKHTEKHVCLFA
jgi:hypothetical protein